MSVYFYSYICPCQGQFLKGFSFETIYGLWLGSYQEKNFNRNYKEINGFKYCIF